MALSYKPPVLDLAKHLPPQRRCIKCKELKPINKFVKRSYYSYSTECCNCLTQDRNIHQKWFESLLPFKAADFENAKDYYNACKDYYENHIPDSQKPRCVASGCNNIVSFPAFRGSYQIAPSRTCSTRCSKRTSKKSNSILTACLSHIGNIQAVIKRGGMFSHYFARTYKTFDISHAYLPDVARQSNVTLHALKAHLYGKAIVMEFSVADKILKGVTSFYKDIDDPSLEQYMRQINRSKNYRGSLRYGHAYSVNTMHYLISNVYIYGDIIDEDCYETSKLKTVVDTYIKSNPGMTYEKVSEFCGHPSSIIPIVLSPGFFEYIRSDFVIHCARRILGYKTNPTEYEKNYLSVSQAPSHV